MKISLTERLFIGTFREKFTEDQFHWILLEKFEQIFQEIVSKFRHNMDIKQTSLHVDRETEALMIDIIYRGSKDEGFFKELKKEIVEVRNNFGKFLCNLRIVK